MSKMNLLIDLKGYEGNNANGCNTKFSKNSLYAGIGLDNETIAEVTVPAGDTLVLFSVASADAKKFIYLEATGECDISVNGVAESTIKPVVINDSANNGVFLKSTNIESVSITNNNAESINIFYITTK